MDETELHVIEAWFAKRRGTSVNVVLAGQIFGGRLGESPQLPSAYSYHESTLRIHFNTAELLVVECPLGVQLENNYALTIHRANFVSFGWYYYGRPKIPENWCEDRYFVSEQTVRYERTGPLFPTQYDLTRSDEHLIKLI